MTVKGSLLEKILIGGLLGLVALLPVFVFPAISLYNVSKTVLLATVALGALIVLIVHNLRAGHVVLPRSWIFVSFSTLFLVSLVSAIASPSRALSLLGFAGTDTVFFLGILLILMYIFSVIFVERERVYMAFALLFISAGVVAITQLLRTIIPGYIPLTVLREQGMSVLGSLSDTAIFFGLISILSLLAIELVPVRKEIRYFLWSLFAVSLFFLTVINMTAVWYVVGGMALLVFVYSFSIHVTHRKQSIPALPLFLVVISVVCILFSGQSIYNIIATVPGLGFMKVFTTNIVEARPGLMTTFDIGNQLLFDKHILGAGPGRFREAWNLYRPIEINATAFWDTDFSVGFSTMMSSYVTLGVLGVLAWLWFLGTFIISGFKSLFRNFENVIHRFLVVFSFVGALYCWIFMSIYSPGVVIIALAVIFTGIFIGSLIHENIIPVSRISIVDDPRIAFAGVSGLVVILIATTIAGYFFATTIFSAIQGTRANLAFAAGDTTAAEKLAVQAINLKEDDSYYRFLTNLALTNLTTFVNTQGIKNQDAKNQVETLIQNTLSVAARAVALDQSDYLNWLNIAQVYQTVTTTESEDTYKQALEAYTKAQELNPQNPAIALAMAQLERAHGDTVKAKESVSRAIAKKQDYTDAYFIMAQILVAEGSIKEAIASAETGTLTAPTNPAVFFQLGLLRYSNKDYQGAARAFERALILNNQYANAQYFLGLTYDKLGRKAEAIEIFEYLKKTNPDNTDVVSTLNNLKNGRTAVPAPTATTTAPEKAKTLPVKERR